MTEKIETKDITFAVDYETAGGRTYKAGATHKVNSPEARILVRLGKARLADAGSEPEAEEQAAPDAASTGAGQSAGDGEATKAATGKGK